MRILVAGGAGFLGVHLCSRLLDAGHEIICLDNEITGNRSNLKAFETNKNFSFVSHDIKEYFYVEVDGIFNLACPASPKSYQKNPVDTFLTSILGAKNLLELARKNSAKILQASTSEVYGDPKISPQQEEYWGNVNPYGTRACYDEGKRGAETLFHDYKQTFGTETRIARIFNTYGPFMSKDDGRVVSNFVVQALTGSAITIYGNGQQIRSLCYVSDLIEGLIRLFFSADPEGPVNIGNPEPTTMVGLADEIIQLTKSNSKIEFLSRPDDDPVVRVPDISKAMRLLDWTPKVSRLDGLQNTIDYFKSIL